MILSELPKESRRFDEVRGCLTARSYRKRKRAFDCESKALNCV